MESWRTVYDFGERLPSLSIAFMCGFAAFGWVIRSYIRSATDDDLMHPWDITHGQMRKFIGTTFLILGSVGVVNGIIKYVQTRNAYVYRAYRSVEGVVREFKTGHREETFTVADVPFAFFTYQSVDGYNTIAAHGGVIRPSLRVRIAYLPSGPRNVILKLEVPASEPRRYGWQ